MGVRNQLKKLVKPIYKYKPFKQLVDLAVRSVWNSKPLRRYFTRQYTSGYLAIGEQNKYCVAPEWVTVDMAGADINYDFRSMSPLPFAAASAELVYTSHMIEHLPEEACQYFFTESHRLLKSGGVIRIEAPDVEKIVSEYKKNNSVFFIELLSRDEKIQFEKGELALHEIFVGLISCYINQDKHIPVTVSKEMVDRQVQALSVSEFAEWCVSLQTREQVETGGHINPIYFDKIKAMLTAAGYRHVAKASVATSAHPLMHQKLSGIERVHRANYSVYVEAMK